MKGQVHNKEFIEENNISDSLMKIEEQSEKLIRIIEKNKNNIENYYLDMLDENIDIEDIEQKSASLKRAMSNITKSLANTYTLSDELNSRANDIRRQNKRRILGAPSNAVIDLKEKITGHFAQGINIYKLLIVCFVGSFLGVVVEMIWCLYKHGYIESRAGLVYGPFNLLYGVGAVVMTVCLYKFRNRGSWISFAGGMLVGAVVEYACSWLQEMVFGSRSWDYTGMPFNINGRICLLYSVFWGILGVLWIKNIYPRMSKLILKIPDKKGKIITWVLTVFFIINSAMSCIALDRYADRRKDIAPSNDFERFIDERFPNERIEKIYANMEFSDED